MNVLPEHLRRDQYDPLRRDVQPDFVSRPVETGLEAVRQLAESVSNDPSEPNSATYAHVGQHDRVLDE